MGFLYVRKLQILLRMRTTYTGTALEAASSFRTFDAARDEFIMQKGYTANRSDKDAKVKFIKHKFEEAGNANTEVV